MIVHSTVAGEYGTSLEVELGDWTCFTILASAGNGTETLAGEYGTSLEVELGDWTCFTILESAGNGTETLAGVNGTIVEVELGDWTCFIILMTRLWDAAVLLLLLAVSVTCRDPLYSNEWAVEVEGGQEEAVRLADKHGFTYGGKIFGDYHLLRHSHVSRRSTSSSHNKHHRLLQEDSVRWVEQQVWKERVARSGVARSRVDRSERVTLDVCLNDPDWPKQEWYMNHCAGLDMHVTGAWQRGYTGQGVNVAVVDDGLQTNHPDLNYDATLSTDVVDGDRDPSHPAGSTGHGTKVAGVATAVANNSLCGVGVAPGARVGVA
ncbi:FURIN [Branchiostoma lanceolatum]|uniref:FURIN protein n=1 Tax=Branchiostoma lanceolatum TaxID=7740 RepID=A0A8J9VFH7_BRALA|nr:FURIN [Branchiostoma lanceolatum]